MSVTQKQIDAARANGARSRGPKTPEGKAISSQNALKHGLLAQAVLVGSESPKGFDAHVDLHMDRFCPRDGLERELIEEMATSSWRMRRAWAMESRMMNDALEEAWNYGKPLTTSGSPRSGPGSTITAKK